MIQSLIENSKYLDAKDFLKPVKKKKKIKDERIKVRASCIKVLLTIRKLRKVFLIKGNGSNLEVQFACQPFVRTF